MTSEAHRDYRGIHHSCFAENVTTYVKRCGGAPPDFFAAEAAGLAWLAAAGAPVVAVHAFDEDSIALDRLHPIAPSRAAARAFGAALARMHQFGASHFGSPPSGYTGRSYIGSRPMTCTPTATWGAFYAQQRVLPYVEVAERVGNLTTADARDVRAACTRLAEGRYDDGSTPARLHGDLWSGNVLYTSDGVVMIDPAAHGGHCETDLAMLDLFGSPHLADALEGYQQVSPLASGWRERIPMHQLHPLAVHAAGHGPGYGPVLAAAARATLELR